MTVAGSAEPTVSITIVLYNSGEDLPACLASLRTSLDGGFAELIAVDNCSPDSSVEILKAHAPEATVIRSSQNRGFAGGVNLSLGHVNGRYWMLLNPDVAMPADALRQLVAWMDRHPEIGIASPEIRDEDGQVSSAGRALPSIAGTLMEAFRIHRLLPGKVRGMLLRGAYWQGGDQLDTGWVPGTVMIARREVPSAVGGLNESIFMYGEDMEWCWRARRAGWRVGVCSGVTVTHAGAASVARTWGQQEATRRLIAGMMQAVCAMRGRLYADLYRRAEALAHWLESIGPGRTASQRRQAREASRIWWQASKRSESESP